MEKDPELRFMCKLCDKKYSCGKSLGGHMRSHVITAAAESGETLEPMNMKKVASLTGESSLKGDMTAAAGGGEAAITDELGGPSGYGLRENPRKTWRAVDSTFPSPPERVCKQCGKGFQSLKALCGHMACHSEKDRVLKDDHSWTSENPKMVVDSDSDSDTEAEDLKRQTRSKSKRYMKISSKSSDLSLSNNIIGTSSVSEIEDQEMEDVALSLMMLSRDSGKWGGVSSVVELSDNNSVVLETKSSSIDMKIERKEGLRVGEENLKFKKLVGDKKLKSSALDVESGQFKNSYSGYPRNGVKKIGSEISYDELHRNGDYKKNPKFRGGGGGRVEIFDAELDKGYNRGRLDENELGKGLTKEKGFGEVGSDSKSMKYASKKRNRDIYHSPEFLKESTKETIYDSSDEEPSKNVHKRSKYECWNCNKTFNSYQALGGHRPCHRKINSSSMYERGEKSLENDEITPDSNPIGKVCNRLSTKKSISRDLCSNGEKRIRPKKSKGHECPICFRMFKSGQALGGHKRSHFINGSEDFSNLSPVINQDASVAADTHDLIDLNLPAPEEDDEADDQFVY